MDQAPLWAQVFVPRRCLFLLRLGVFFFSGSIILYIYVFFLKYIHIFLGGKVGFLFRVVRWDFCFG